MMLSDLAAALTTAVVLLLYATGNLQNLASLCQRGYYRDLAGLLFDHT